MTKCLSNMKQIGLACTLYAGDYEKYPLHEVAGTAPFSSTPIANQSRYAAVYYTTKWLDHIDPYLGSNASVAICPSDNLKLPTDATTFKITGPLQRPWPSEKMVNRLKLQRPATSLCWIRPIKTSRS